MNINKVKEESPHLVILKILIGIGFLVILSCNLKPLRHQQFSFLADALLNGKLYFLEQPSTSWEDTSPYKGKNYWPLGIMPAILLTPGIAVFGKNFHQGFMTIGANLLNAFLLFKIAENYTKNKTKSLFLTFSYIFGSAYLMAAMMHFSWYFAHVIATTLLLSALYFTLIKEKSLLGGSFFAAAFLTRISISLGIILFLLHYLDKYKRNKEWGDFLRFLAPVGLGILVFGLYNYLRFESFFETGYKYQLIFPELMANRAAGMWSFKHFPANIYLAFFKTPEVIFEKGSLMIREISPSFIGMGLIYTSPLFLFTTKANLSKKENRFSLAAIVTIAFFLFGSFGLGASQYGYRFALDFQPFLFLLLCDVFKEIEISRKLLFFVISSFAFNLIMIIKYFTPL